MSDDEPSRLDILEQRLDALTTRNNHLQERVWELQDENEQLRDRVAELEQVVDPDPGSVNYEQLTKSQKVHRVRVALVEKAAREHNGKTRMDYNDVVWLFDGNPSPGHAYDLMERAGELDGFEYDKPDGGNKRITANLDAVKDETLIHAANKASAGGAV